MLTHSNCRRRSPRPLGFGLIPTAFAAVLSLATVAEARITQLQVTRIESPTFGGMSFGSVGAYEKITARAFGEVDPTLPANALMTDIQSAPRNARGMVEYSTDVFMLKPIDPSKGSGKIFYDVVNRGSKGSYTTFNQAPAPSSVANTDASGAGTGLLMRRGYTIVWSGWEDPAIIGTGPNTLTASLPIARNPDGSSIVEKMIVEQIFDNATGTDVPLPYAAANLDQNQAYMVVHNHTQFVGGPLVNRVTVPTRAWSYVNDTTVRINRADPFLAPYDQGAAFEFVFPAKDPIVLALGFAATRDLISFLKHDTTAQNPVRNSIQWALGRGDSQSGRYLKGLLYWGFNADENGSIVFDGMSPHISGSHAIASNDRFGDSNATGRSYQRHLSAKMEFPFTYGVRENPFTHVVDGIMKRCLASNTCPKIMHTDSGNEPYLKPVSLITTDGPGNGATPTDIVLPGNVRVYTIGNSQHAPQSGVTTTPSGVCQQPGNPNPWAPHVRALGIALDDWVTAGIAPPTSRYARVDDGTLVHSLPQTELGFPSIPGVTYTGWYNPVDELDKSVLPNAPIPGESYTILVPKTDADGNSISGIRTPDVQVPIATYTGWALRRAPFAANEDCALTGQYIPFPVTKAQRIATGDPRLSVEERYGSIGNYNFRYAQVVKQMMADRTLLAEDGGAMVQAAVARVRPLLPALPTAQAACEVLATVQMPASQFSLPTTGAVINSATFVQATDAGNSNSEYCKVLGSIKPVDPAAPDIKFQVNLPSNWNQKALQFGGGGYDGNIPDTLRFPILGLSTIPTPLASGYITYASDSGHAAADTNDASFAVNDEALNNFAYMHVKKVRDAMAALAQQRYGMSPRRVYWTGGSTGGREGLTAAMRFPEAFDGIMSNYPTANFMGLRLWGAVLAHAVYDNNSAGWIAPTMVNKIAADTLAACDTLDGAADGLVSNMAVCRSISSAYRTAIACQNGETGYPANCLTQPQLGTIGVYHEGYQLPYSFANNITNYPGYNALEGITMELGSQAAYTNPVIDNVNAHHVARADQFVKYFVTRDPNFNLLTFDAIHPGVWQDRIISLSNTIDATNPDLSTFQAKGGKILLMQGLDDPSVSPYANERLYLSILARMGQATTNGFMRFYLVPGLAHGNGKYLINWDNLNILDNWVENRVAPPTNAVSVDGNRNSGGRTRPVCVYPTWPKYVGPGSQTDAANYACVTQ